MYFHYDHLVMFSQRFTSDMAGDGEENEDFALSSGDEAQLIAMAESTEKPNTGTKRQGPPTIEAHLPKKLAVRVYPTQSPLAVGILKERFGLKAFRLKQEHAIARILGGGNACVVFPTGGGKSLCYQIPALAFSELDKLYGLRGEAEGGISLVVSPLIALMKDQVDALVRRGIRAACIDSTKSREEYLETCGMLREGTLKLLYCAPERLNNEGFFEQMKTVRGGIRLVAVDEAHCISEWGHEFRPDYLKVSRFVKEVNAERVICLTATAIPRVARDICKAFDVDDSGLFRTSTYRPNLQLLAESASTKEDLYPKLFSFLRSNAGPSVVYVTLQKQTEHLAQKLCEQGFKAKAFHAGMQTPQKTALQEEFMASSDLIIVATIAFGMGIDKADIRNVVHFNIPRSLESYSQEIGRAGRDGCVSKCLLCVCGEDLHLREIFARGDIPSRESVRALLRDIFNPTNAGLAIGENLKASHLDQQKKFDIRATTLSNIYAQLELRFHLLRAISPMYTTHTFIAGAAYSSGLNSDRSAAAAAVMDFAKQAKKFHRLDVNDAAVSKSIPRNDIVRKLNEWNESGIIELKVGGVVNVYLVLRKLPSTQVEVDALVQDLYSQMEAREQQALHRTEEVLNLIRGNTCFSRSLANHFDDDLPDGKTKCGHCTWCYTNRPLRLRFPSPVPFNKSLFDEILRRVPDRDDPRFLARIAFGIKSPRVTAMKLSKDSLFESMASHDFMVRAVFCHMP